MEFVVGNDFGPTDRIVGSIVDMAGISRAKVLPAPRLSTFVDAGAGASPSWSVFCVDDHSRSRRPSPWWATFDCGSTPAT